MSSDRCHKTQNPQRRGCDWKQPEGSVENGIKAVENDSKKSPEEKR